MKRAWIIIVLILGMGSGFSQTVTNETYEYREIEDNPDRVPDKMLHMELCGPVTFSKGGSLTMGVGLTGLWGINDKLQAMGNFDFNFIQMNGGMGFVLEGGAGYTIGEKSKEKEIRVVLKYSDRSYNTATHHVRETSATWLNATGTILSKWKARGGAYLCKLTYENEKEFANYGKVPYTTAGVYGGIELSQQGALVSEVDGQKGITSGLTRVYVDAFLLPLRSFANDTGGAIRSAVGGGFLGGRFGFQTTFNPAKSKKAHDGPLVNYQVYPKMYFKIETGYRPAEGIFFKMGAGFLIWKNR